MGAGFLSSTGPGVRHRHRENAMSPQHPHWIKIGLPWIPITYTESCWQKNQTPLQRQICGDVGRIYSRYRYRLSREVQLISTTDTDFGPETNEFCNSFGCKGSFSRCWHRTRQACGSLKLHVKFPGPFFYRNWAEHATDWVLIGREEHWGSPQKRKKLCRKWNANNLRCYPPLKKLLTQKKLRKYFRGDCDTFA